MLKVKRGDFLIKQFLKRNNVRASYQIISTIFPIISIWLIVHQIINQPFSLLTKEERSILKVFGRLIFLAERNS